MFLGIALKILICLVFLVCNIFICVIEYAPSDCFFVERFLGQLLVFLSDLAVLLFWNRIRENVHTVVLLGKQEPQLSPSDRAMRLVSSSLANYHATVQKLLVRQVLTKLMVWSWRFSWRQCVINVCTQPRRDRVALIVSGVINKPTTDELCISRVYRRLAAVKFSKSTM